ncbi:hypothetical protein C440_00450 [Haloferax mucosum ATCC BAA-1512]|uniref:Uncharacterized protein n=1 Tax=Haloferax mucosum ATCC BAA-1512 TaxID=662479 RepID=M0IPW5_9EURY|nr:hypothetical protein [Haloferax mucosum]ELZ98780.1 hypothetical protein C440_00450 [Haloferax mucosum ATCC BAA-1512]
MAQTVLFVGFLLGAALLALIVFFTGRGRRHYTVTAVPTGGGSRRDTGRQWSKDPTVLSLVFLLVTFGFGAIAVLFIGGSGIPDEATNVAGAALVTATVSVVVSYLFYGTYHAARGRGLKRSQAALAGSWVIGALFIIGVTLRLLGLL